MVDRQRFEIQALRSGGESVVRLQVPPGLSQPNTCGRHLENAGQIGHDCDVSVRLVLVVFSLRSDATSNACAALRLPSLIVSLFAAWGADPPLMTSRAGLVLVVTPERSRDTFPERRLYAGGSVSYTEAKARNLSVSSVYPVWPMWFNNPTCVI